MNREPMRNAKALFREGSDTQKWRENGDRLRGGLLEAGAYEPGLLGWPGSGPKAPYLGATPDSTAEGSIVAGNDRTVHQGAGEAWGLREVQGLVVGWLIRDACW